MYRQGDVSLHKVEKLPKGLIKAKNNILAYGEVTGHRHELAAKQRCVYEDAAENKYVDLAQDTELVHDFEGGSGVADTASAALQDLHLKQTIRKGLYAVKIEQEYDPLTEEIEQVLD